MASDLSSFLKDELSNTLEQLLSKKCIINSINDATNDLFKESQCIEILVKFEFQNIVSNWTFVIPTAFATKLEYFMLGGMSDIKEHLDDEVLDAVNEIISNISGSFCTSVNAQGFADVSSIKSTVLGVSIKESSIISDLQNKYEIKISLEAEKFSMIISFDKIILTYLSQLNSNISLHTEISTNIEQNNISSNIISSTNNQNDIDANSLLSQEAKKNLQLLFNIKLKLSVRLGTKLFLLKDILQWDIGKIIELEQMVNEPLEILINGVQIGEGEAVIVEGKFGLKIKNIKTNVATLSNLGL